MFYPLSLTSPLVLISPSAVLSSVTVASSLVKRDLELLRVLDPGFVTPATARRLQLTWLGAAIGPWAWPIGPFQPRVCLSDKGRETNGRHPDLRLSKRARATRRAIHVRLGRWRVTTGFLGVNIPGGEKPRSFASPLRGSGSPLSTETQLPDGNIALASRTGTLAHRINHTPGDATYGTGLMVVQISGIRDPEQSRCRTPPGLVSA